MQAMWPGREDCAGCMATVLEGTKGVQFQMTGTGDAMVLSMMQSAMKATSPIVAIPIPGEEPFIVRRDLLVGSLRDLTVIDAGIQMPLDGKRENARLNVFAVGEGVRSSRAFRPIDRNHILRTVWDWAEAERERRGKPKAPKTSARQKKIAQLEKRLAKMGEIQPPAPRLIDGQREVQWRREHDEKQLAAWVSMVVEGSEIEQPLTVGQEWAEWKRQASVRRWIQAQARLTLGQSKQVRSKRPGWKIPKRWSPTRAAYNMTDLYKTLESRGVPATKWTELPTRRGDKTSTNGYKRYESIFDYLNDLWRNCRGMALKPSYYFDVYDMAKETGDRDGAIDDPDGEMIKVGHYQYWLERCRERRELLSMIDSLKQMEAEIDKETQT